MTNSKLRSWEIEINNFDEVDIEEIFNQTEICDYSIVGFEGCDPLSEYHPHIHCFMHYPNPISKSGLLKRFTRKPHVDLVRSPQRYVDYCKGYEDGVLKEPLVGENIYFESGIPPISGINKKHNSEFVMKGIKEGKSLVELRDLYPMYMMHHESKVSAFIDKTRNIPPIQFYYINPISDVITEVQEIFGNKFEYVFVTELDELEAYDNYDVVVFMSEMFRPIHALWPRGCKLTYKYGYQVKQIRCSKFVYVRGRYMDCDDEFKYYKKVNSDYGIDDKPNMDVLHREITISNSPKKSKKSKKRSIPCGPFFE